MNHEMWSRRILQLAALGIILPACFSLRPGYAAGEVGADTARTAHPPSLRVDGNHFVDGSGNVVQLRGVNMAGFGLFSVQGWAWTNGTYDNWAGQEPKWPVFARWGVNAVRLPLNEASWLGLITHDPVANNSGGPEHKQMPAGSLRAADPGKNYRKQYTDAVKAATAQGLYVIIDLHSNGPNISLQCVQKAAESGKQDDFYCPATTDFKVPMTPFVPGYVQNPLPDADYSSSFWTSVAETFKGYPNVIFDLFNEPFISPWFNPPEGQWTAWLKGTTVPFYNTGGTPWRIRENWQSEGMQSLIGTVRATGAANVIMVGGLGYAGDMSGWLDNMPSDPLHQLAAAWHAYPGSYDVKDPKSKLPGWGDKQYGYVNAIAQKIPVIIGELGDHNVSGTKGAPFVSVLLPWADSRGISYLGWSWNTFGSPDNVLIKDFDGTPTDGYGEYFRDHLLCLQRGGKSQSCR